MATLPVHVSMQRLQWPWPLAPVCICMHVAWLPRPGDPPTCAAPPRLPRLQGTSKKLTNNTLDYGVMICILDTGEGRHAAGGSGHLGLVLF
jgi:hypothetical protein